MAKKRGQDAVFILTVGAEIDEFYGTSDMPWKPGKIATVEADVFTAESGVVYKVSERGARWRTPSAHLRAVLAKAAEGPAEPAEPAEPDHEEARQQMTPNGVIQTPETTKGASPKAKPPRPSLEVAIERYGNLDRELQPFMTRLESWIPVDPENPENGDLLQTALDNATECFRGAWAGLGEQLRDMQANGTVVKVTNRSRRDAWMRAGAEVALRQDTFQRFLACIPCSVLENLTIKVVGDEDVFLVSGDRDIGMVPKAQVMRRKRSSGT
jgi:hypothetical protein